MIVPRKRRRGGFDGMTLVASRVSCDQGEK